MATFTLTSDSNWHDLDSSARAGGDTYAVNGCVLTLDGDTRYGPHTTPTTGTLGNLTLHAQLGGTLLIDATNVRLIPFDTGVGDVPVADTLIVQGGVSAKLLGVWSAINAAPVAAGSPMPPTGFIKVRQKAGGSYAVGLLTGIGARASGGDVVGWIEVVGDETLVLNCQTKLGTLRTRGDWFELGVTNGARGQTFVLPTSGGTAFNVPAVFIETQVGSGVFYPWPCVSTYIANLGWSPANLGSDSRSPLVECTGLVVRIGSDGANDVGHLPVAGLRVVIPNIVLQNCTAAARGVTAYPNATLATRYEIAANAGNVDLEKISSNWYMIVGLPQSLRVVDSAWSGALTITAAATPVLIQRCGSGVAEIVNTQGLSISYCTAEGSVIEDCHLARNVSSGSTRALVVGQCQDMTIRRCRTSFTTMRTVAPTYGSIYLTTCDRVSVQDCVAVTGYYVGMSSDCEISRCQVFDRHVGTTDNLLPWYGVTFYDCERVLLDEFALFPDVANVHPYTGLISLTYCDGVVIEGVGTVADPLDCGTVAGCGYPIYSAGFNRDLVARRCFFKNTRSGVAVGHYADFGPYRFDNVGGDAGDSVTGLIGGRNQIARGCLLGGSVPTAMAGLEGSHFWEAFNAATTGRFGILMSPPSPATSPLVALTGTAAFNRMGALVVPGLDDSCTWEWPHFILGYTGLTTWTATGGSTRFTNCSYEYCLDKNDGTGYGAWQPLDGAHLAAETGIDPVRGFRPKIRVTTTIAALASTNYVTGIYLTGATDAVSQLALYPDDNFLAGSSLQASTGSGELSTGQVLLGVTEQVQGGSGVLSQQLDGETLQASTGSGDLVTTNTMHGTTLQAQTGSAGLTTATILGTCTVSFQVLNYCRVGIEQINAVAVGVEET